LFLVVVKEVGIDVKFNRVVTCSDGVNVPLNVVIGLHFFDEVKVVSHEERNEYGSTSKQKASFLPRDNCSFWKLATDLDKELRSIAKTGATLFSYWNVNKLVKFEDLTVVLANALCLKFCLELCAV